MQLSQALVKDCVQIAPVCGAQFHVAQHLNMHVAYAVACFLIVGILGSTARTTRHHVMLGQNPASPPEKPIQFVVDGVRKEIPERQALQMLATLAEKDAQKALGLYLQLTDTNPHAQKLLSAFYQTLFDLFMFEELLELCNRRLTAIPNCYISFSRKIDALQQMFRNQEVIAAVKLVVQANPNDPVSRNILGGFLKSEGRFEESRQYYDEAISSHPDYAPTYWNRSDLSTDPEVDLARVSDVISSGKISDEEAHNLHFAAYRLAEKLGLFDDAIAYLQIANGLKRRLIDYDVTEEIQIDQAAQRAFTREYLDQFQPEPVSDLRPIFIMGMPRSGTTLVEQIIASHSEVAGGDEYTALANAITRSQKSSKVGGQVDQWLATRADKDWQRIAKIYESNMRFVRGSKTVFTDKNQFNHRSIGIIKASLANAKIVVVDRNPMDVAFGCYRQLFNEQGVRFSYDFSEIATMYASYQELIRHWQDVTDGMIMRVKYEDLVLLSLIHI